MHNEDNIGVEVYVDFLNKVCRLFYPSPWRSFFRFCHCCLEQILETRAHRIKVPLIFTIVFLPPCNSYHVSRHEVVRDMKAEYRAFVVCIFVQIFLVKIALKKKKFHTFIFISTIGVLSLPSFTCLYFKLTYITFYKDFENYYYFFLNIRT